jgi:S-DNA-T family DNA segregation ATPase FtsK/SpoIIIE
MRIMTKEKTSKKHTSKRGRPEKEKDDDTSSRPEMRSVSSEAVRGVIAIFCIALSIFLILAGIGHGGHVGVSVYSGLSWLLGAGYALLPLSCVLTAILIFRSFERHFGWVQSISMGVMMFASLGLIELFFPLHGGALGGVITHPLISIMDTVATGVFLTAFVIASCVIAFDVHLGAVLASIRERIKEYRLSRELAAQADEETPSVHIPEEPVPAPAAVSEEPVDAPEEAPAKEGRGIIGRILGGKEENDFPLIGTTHGTYTPPPVSLLSKTKGKPEVGDVKANVNIIKRTLQNFGIQVEMDEASIGPTVTRYAIKPAEGVRLSKIVALQSNLELALAASPLRIEAPIPGKSLVGIEVPNIVRTTLGMAPLVADEEFAQSSKPLMMALGRTITGSPVYADLARMPHILVAGTTGSGKSVTIHDLVISLLYRCGPERLRFIMVDPKRVELTLYNSIPHLLTPVITDAKKCILALKWLAKEMERRYNILETEAVRDIASYHENVFAPAMEKADGKETDKPLPEAMPYIVVIIDELADIMQAYPRELEAGIVRLAQMSRAVGIHLILSTQRPSVKVITGLIKANIPARIALQVASQIDSRTILDMGGAEKLLGAGDMLFLSGDMSKPRRVQAPYISEKEVKSIVAQIVKLNESTLQSEITLEENGKIGSGMDPIFSSSIGSSDDDEEEDDLYPEAKKTVIEAGKASTSYLQRKLGIGYARAARLIDMLEDRGVIGPGDGAKARTVIGDGNADDLVREAEANDPYAE